MLLNPTIKKKQKNRKTKERAGTIRTLRKAAGSRVRKLLMFWLNVYIGMNQNLITYADASGQLF